MLLLIYNVVSSLTYNQGNVCPKETVMVIYTHEDPDLDSVASVWAAREYCGMRGANVNFCPASWDGSGIEPGDLAVDMWAGGKGIKGRKEGIVVHSCFEFLMDNYASKEVRAIFRPLIEFIDILDSRGAVINHLVPDADKSVKAVLTSATLNSIFLALKEEIVGDEEELERDELELRWQMVIDEMSKYFSGMLKYGLRRMRVLKGNIKDVVEFFGSDRQVALVHNSDHFLHGYLFGHGAKIIVYDSKVGLGVVRNSRSDEAAEFRTDNSLVRSIVDETGGESVEWFAHPSGFMYCRGTRKSRVKTRSRVDPRKLAEAVARSWEEYKSNKSAG
jgi:hypothetical protein